MVVVGGGGGSVAAAQVKIACNANMQQVASVKVLSSGCEFSFHYSVFSFIQHTECLTVGYPLLFCFVAAHILLETKMGARERTKRTGKKEQSCAARTKNGLCVCVWFVVFNIGPKKLL